MAEDKKTSAVYEFLLSRIDTVTKTLHTITDFHYIAFVRSPITKQGTFIDMEAMVPNDALAIIETDINCGNFPVWEMTAYQLKDVDKSNQNNDNVQKIFYSSFINIISISRQKDNTSTDKATAEAAIPVRMLLVHPIAYQMSANTGFNKIFSPSTDEASYNPQLIALETIINNSFNPQYSDSELSSFMQYVRNKYGGSTESQDIKQIILADPDTINLTNYSQITIPPTIPEINVPEYIIGTYKPFTTPSFWFFDTFNFGNYDGESEPKNGKIPIWCFIINFYNCLKTFKMVDVSQDSDIMTYTHLIKSVPFVDSQKILNRPNAIINFISPNMTQTMEKLGDLPKTTMVDNTLGKQEARMTSLKVYYPDNLDNAKSRMVDCMDLFNKQISQIEYYETPNTSPEWLQFGKLYNLEKDYKSGINTNNYIHTPISIINIFKRRQTVDNTLECINKYAMLRLVNTEAQVVMVSTPTPVPTPDPPTGPPPSPIPPPIPPPAYVAPPGVEPVPKLTYTKSSALNAQTKIRFQEGKKQYFIKKYNDEKAAGLNPSENSLNQELAAIRTWILEQRQIIDTYNSETGESLSYT